METKDLVQRIWPFFIVFFIYNFVAMALIQYFGRDQLHLFINQFHHPFFDTFFKYYTNFGTTGFFILLILYVVWKSNWIHLGYIALAELFASVVNLFTKRIFFKHVHRPSYYFYQKNVDLYMIEGAQLQIPYTFPSGHTLLGCIVAMMLCILTKNRVLQFVFALHFPLIAYSRMYLSKHFAIDTLGGGILGFFTFIFVYYVLNNLNKDFLNRPILNRNAIRN